MMKFVAGVTSVVSGLTLSASVFATNLIPAATLTGAGTDAVDTVTGLSNWAIPLGITIGVLVALPSLGRKFVGKVVH